MDYINREMSWLAFNARVLGEAMDARTPLLERLKFLAIFTTNLDEYFMIRVAGIKKQIDSAVRARTPDGLTPVEQINAINEHLYPLLQKLQDTYEEIQPFLALEGIQVLTYDALSEADKARLQIHFNDNIFPVLTPLAVGPAHPFPYISNLSLSLAVVITDPDGEEQFARVKVPHRLLSRFIPLENKYHFLPIEQLIAANLHSLFPGMTIQAAYPFRVTRNADLEIQEDEAEDLLLTMEQELRRRRFGEVVRLEVSPDLPPILRRELMEALDIEETFVYTVPGLMDMSSLFSFTGLDFPHLKEKPFIARTPARLTSETNFFENIRDHGDILVHHPYENFATSVERFIQEAVADPQVLAIKQTLYRTGGEGSVIIQSLMEAAEKGKQVAVLVELKARFDEANNISWARALETVGVHVVYGLIGLKTHCKVALVIRLEQGVLRRYVHIGTGNYNAKTSKLYTDLGLFTCDPQIGADATDLFNSLTGYSTFDTYRKLLVAPVTLRQRLVDLITQEVERHSPEKPGYIILKMNSLVDPQLIEQLYNASNAGVRIRLIVRGICCLRPGVPGLSENIRVVSIIGRFLEHARILYFQNVGAVYLGSADWMTRNLDKRVEVMVPVEQPQLRQELIHYLELSLQDTRQAHYLQPDGSYIRPVVAPKEEPFSVQAHLTGS